MLGGIEYKSLLPELLIKQSELIKESESTIA